MTPETEVEKLARDIEDHICHGQDIIATRVAWPWLVGILRPVLEAKDAEIARRIEPERAEQAWEAAHERLKAERDAAQQALREAQERIAKLESAAARAKKALDHPSNATFAEVCRRGTDAWKMLFDVMKAPPSPRSAEPVSEQDSVDPSTRKA